MDGWMDGWMDARGSNLVDVVIWVSSARRGCAHGFFFTRLGGNAGPSAWKTMISWCGYYAMILTQIF